MITFVDELIYVLFPQAPKVSQECMPLALALEGTERENMKRGEMTERENVIGGEMADILDTGEKRGTHDQIFKYTN